MKWIINLLTSSIGQKLVMSLTGLFLISFVIVHLIGNLQLLVDDGGYAFNTYAYFMTNNPLIKTISLGLYFFILLHAVQGLLIYFTNKKKSGGKSASKYAVRTYENGSWASKNMALLGTLILFFLCVHMGDFWYKMKFTDDLAMVTYDGYDQPIKDLYTRVSVAFQELWIVAVYLVGLFALAFHLMHGFSSAFQTLGLRHKKYTPLINGIGITLSVIIPLAYAVIPIWSYFK